MPRYRVPDVTVSVVIALHVALCLSYQGRLLAVVKLFIPVPPSIHMSMFKNKNLAAA